MSQPKVSLVCGTAISALSTQVRPEHYNSLSNNAKDAKDANPPFLTDYGHNPQVGALLPPPISTTLTSRIIKPQDMLHVAGGQARMMNLAAKPLDSSNPDQPQQGASYPYPQEKITEQAIAFACRDTDAKASLDAQRLVDLPDNRMPHVAADLDQRLGYQNAVLLASNWIMKHFSQTLSDSKRDKLVSHFTKDLEASQKFQEEWYHKTCQELAEQCKTVLTSLSVQFLAKEEVNRCYQLLQESQVKAWFLRWALLVIREQHFELWKNAPNTSYTGGMGEKGMASYAPFPLAAPSEIAKGLLIKHANTNTNNTKTILKSKL